MAFLAGKSGGITIGGATWKLSEWAVDMQSEAVDVTNFESAGYVENIAGLTKATITAKGKFDSTLMGATAGTSYAFSLEASGSLAYAVTARITSIKLVTEVSKAVEVEVTAESNGSFTASIV
jgi:hypothetical protein